MTTREQIIAAAKEAGFYECSTLPSDWDAGDFICNRYDIERFHAVVANLAKDECAELCYEQNWLVRGADMAEMILATKEPE